MAVETTPHPLTRRLTDWLAQEHRRGTRSVGINGAQGCGKSTLAQALVDELATRHNLRATVLSLDDLYLPRINRLALAREVHPLLATRGVPGTHDVALGMRLIDALLGLPAGTDLALPRFLKLADDRAPASQWRHVTGIVDLVLFEGWCVGTPPQRPEQLATPTNRLERKADPDGVWRRWVNAQLARDYAPLFARLQRLIFLAAPGFDCVLCWRLEQEATNQARETGPRMNRDAIRHFIAHYERLTRHALAQLPSTADAVARLGPQRELQSLTLKATDGSA